MSTTVSTPDRGSLGESQGAPQPSGQSQPAKPKRVLACVLCQQRKVRCDRRFPCANCVKANAECVPATLLPRQRRRRFPERVLLDRVRMYEDILRQNRIKFEPLHGAEAGDLKESPETAVDDDSDDGPQEPETADSPASSSTSRSRKLQEPKDIWQAMNQSFKNLDLDIEDAYIDLKEVATKKAWDTRYRNDDHLLFGSRQSSVDLATLHPEPVQLFKLWQIYLDNVNPLLKVTHTPTLQARIIGAVGNLSQVPAPLEALMFAIYCISITTLADCEATMQAPKKELLTKYQFGCQQALLNAGYLRTGDRDCLTALFLYLMAVGPSTDPRSLSSMLALAMRIADRMGIQSEAQCSKHIGLDSEMRRRLWWALMMFDTRIGELADYKSASLSPLWDCAVPLNVNDSELRENMKLPPSAQGQSTEAIFAVVRYEIGEYIRYARFHLDFTRPQLQPLGEHVSKGFESEKTELDEFEKTIEEKYLKYCDPDVPLHYMTIWTARLNIARCRLITHYSRFGGTEAPTEADRDAAISNVLYMLDCDTKILSSPLTKGYLWLTYFYFPLPGYIHLIQDLRRRPTHMYAEQAWEAMTTNWETRREEGRNFKDGPLIQIFSYVVLLGWEARVAAMSKIGETMVEPGIVTHMKKAREELNAPPVEPPSILNNDPMMDINLDNLPMPMFGDFGSSEQSAGTDPSAFPSPQGQNMFDLGVQQFNWSTTNWGWGDRQQWRF